MALPLEPLEPPRVAHTDADSPLGWVRARRRELLERQTKEFQLPGWEKGDEHGLFGRYRRLGVDRIHEILNSPDGTRLERNAQLLVEACQAVVLRDDRGETILAAGYTHPLQEQLEVTLVPNAELGEEHQLVLGVFGGDEPLLCGHAADVHEWMVHLNDADEQAIAETVAGG